jgi:hypothetical protein
VRATTPALIAAAAGVGFGHAFLPDHWLPLAVIGRARGYPLARVARLSGLAGFAHVLVSVLLGTVVIAVGLQFRSPIQSAQDMIIGVILMLTGVGFAALELTRHRHRHDHGHHQGHAHIRAANTGRRFQGLAGVMVPFGAAASPDLTILPVFLAAAAAGAATAIGALLVFAAATIGTIVGLTLTACFGGYQIRGHWLERRGNTLAALLLLIIGALVLAGVI